MSIIDFIDWLGRFEGESSFLFSSFFWRFLAVVVYIVCALVRPFLCFLIQLLIKKKKKKH